MGINLNEVSVGRGRVMVAERHQFSFSCKLVRSPTNKESVICRTDNASSLHQRASLLDCGRRGGPNVVHRILPPGATRISCGARAIRVAIRYESGSFTRASQDDSTTGSRPTAIRDARALFEQHRLSNS